MPYFIDSRSIQAPLSVQGTICLVFEQQCITIIFISAHRPNSFSLILLNIKLHLYFGLRLLLKLLDLHRGKLRQLLDGFHAKAPKKLLCRTEQ